MLSHNDATGKNISPDYPEPLWAQTALLGVAFIGSVVGMLIMGYLGDLLGIEQALVVTNALVVVGALASATLSWGDASTVWKVIAWSRFFLGVGVGGLYPLSAVKAAKGVGDNDPSAAVEKAGQAFFWQAPGALAPYVFAYFLLQLPHSNGITSLQFRSLLGAGALPALVMLLVAICEARAEAIENRANTEKVTAGMGSRETKLAAAHHVQSKYDARHWQTLIGTGGCWFLFDIAFYGTVIFAPRILKDIFGESQSLTQVALCAAMMACIGTLGTAFGLVMLPRIGAKNLNTCGFLLSALLFLSFAITHWQLAERHMLLFVQLCLLYVTLYAGPNIATFVLPVLSFPSDVRSTFHGLSAASAKAGAMVGTLLFPVIDRLSGVMAVMLMQSLLCILGALLNHVCVVSDPDFGRMALGQDSDCSGASVFGASPEITDDVDSEELPPLMKEVGMLEATDMVEDMNFRPQQLTLS